MADGTVLNPPKNLTASPQYVVSTPSAPGAVSLSWENGDYNGALGYYTYVERQQWGQPFVQISRVDYNVTNYADLSVRSGMQYKYRVRSYGPGGFSAYSNLSGEVYTTPSAPVSVELTRATGTSVDATVTLFPGNIYFPPEGFAYQYRVDGGAWSAETKVAYASGFTFNPGAGQVQARVRTYRGPLYSDYVESNTILASIAPGAPTVSTDPVAVAATDQPVTALWVPNHPDGSAQTSAQVEVTLPGSAAETYDVSGGTTAYAVPGTAAAGTMRIRVRTKGLDPDWGAWSGYVDVDIAVPPVVNFTFPAADGDDIGALPLMLEWSANDSTGISSQQLSVLGADGGALWSAALDGSARSQALSMGQVAFANGTSYTASLTAYGGSGLSFTVERDFHTAFVGPAAPVGTVSYDSDDLSASVTVRDGSGDAVEGTTAKVSGRGGSPLPGLTVYGNTRQNLWVNPPSQTKTGVTITTNADGSIVLSGTATADTYLYASNYYNIVPGKQYTLNVDKAPLSNTRIYVQGKNSTNGNVGTLQVEAGETVATYTAPSTLSYAILGVFVASGTTASGTYRVMLNEGSTAEPWCPPGINGVDELSIVTAGKNLLKSIGISETNRPNEMQKSLSSKGVSFTLNDDGTVSVIGTATDRVAVYLSLGEQGIALPNNTEVSISGMTYCRFKKEGVQLENAYVGSKYTFESSYDSALLFAWFVINSGETINKTFYPQLELGSTATAYEPPAVTTTPVDLDGHTLNSLPDGTRDELRIDASGKVTLVQRVGVVTAPTDASGWKWDSPFLRGSFTIPTSSLGVSNASSLRCDKLPPRMHGAAANDGTYALTSGTAGFARVSTADTLSELVPIAGGAMYIYHLATPQEVGLPGVSMPVLPSDDTTVYASAPVPATVKATFPPAVSYSVTRRLPDGSSWMVADGLSEGQTARDPLPPLNLPYEYIVTAFAESGSITQTTVPALMSAERTALNFGPGASECEVVALDPARSRSVEIATDFYDFADGGESDGLPVAYSTTAVEATGKESAVVLDIAQYRRIESLARRYPMCWIRDVHGGRSYCHAAWSFSAAVPLDKITVSASLTETRWREA